MPIPVEHIDTAVQTMQIPNDDDFAKRTVFVLGRSYMSHTVNDRSVTFR